MRLTVNFAPPGCLTPSRLSRVMVFIAIHHPAAYTWISSDLDRHYVFELEDEHGVLQALVWFYWVPGTLWLLMHACSSPEARGRWISRRNLPVVLNIEHVLEARGFINKVFSPLVARTLSRLGWRKASPNIYIRERNDELRPKSTWQLAGYQEAQRAPAAAADPLSVLSPAAAEGGRGEEAAAIPDTR